MINLFSGWHTPPPTQDQFKGGLTPYPPKKNKNGYYKYVLTSPKVVLLYKCNYKEKLNMKMTEQEMIIKGLNERGWSQTELAKRMGMKGQTNIARYIYQSKNIGVKNFVSIMNAMGYEVIVKDKMASEKNSEEWLLSGKSEEE